MNNLLYHNAVYFKKKILPYTFLIKTTKGIIVISTTVHDFAHLVGKQYTNNSSISRLNTKDFFFKALKKEITYEDLLKIETSKNYLHHQWITEKNETFIDLFKSFESCERLSIYKAIGAEIFTQIDMDYFHLKTALTTSLLGLIGSDKENVFSFNTILSNLESTSRFEKFQKIKVLEIKKIQNKYLDAELKKTTDKIVKSQRNKSNSVKRNKQLDIKRMKKDIEKNLIDNLSISIGMYGKNSIQVYKNDKCIETNLKFNKLKYNTAKLIAEYINETYK